MDIILATRNPSKAEQVRAIFDGSVAKIQTLDEVGITGDAIEDGLTLEENALKKARFARQYLSNHFVMADDTGFFINALNGAPGIHAARWVGDDATTEEIMAHTLRLLEGVVDRTAAFKTAVALITPNGQEYFFCGEVGGHILTKPRIKPQPKMPYSAIFVCEGTDLVWAEMSTEFENTISHRGQAFRQARTFIESLF